MFKEILEEHNKFPITIEEDSSIVVMIYSLTVSYANITQYIPSSHKLWKKKK